jgi:gluconokinase
MTPRFFTPTDKAVGPFVLGLDIGSGGTRAALYDSSGREVDSRKHKVIHTFATAADGTSTIDADQVVSEIRTAIGAVLAPDADGSVPGPIVGIGFDTFASSLVVVGADGEALTPCFTYADSRSHEQVRTLAQHVDVAELHDRVGSRLHTSYTAPRLLWLRDEYPEVFAAAHTYMALGEYVAHRLLGTAAIGTACAAWGGLTDRRTGQYVPELLDVVGVEPSRLTTPRDPAESVPVADTPLATEFPQLAGASWVPVVGDGLVANIGIGAVGAGTWGISTATSGAIRQLLDTEIGALPPGLWAYRMDARRTLVGSAMSDCGRVIDFARSRFALPEDLGELDLDALLTTPPTPGTPLVVPFLSGERGTKWRGDARALFAGVSAATGPADLLRGCYEGIALCYLRIADQLRAVGGEPRRIVLSGGMSDVAPQWIQILADALQVPVDHVGISRSTMRGAALLALEQTAPDSDLATIPVRGSWEPRSDAGAYYRERLARFEVLADVA